MQHEASADLGGTLGNAVSRSKKDQFADDEVWRVLEASDNLAFPEKWLAFQCSLIDEIKSACLILGSSEQFRPVANWPNGTQPSASVIRAAELALEQAQDIVLKASSPNSNVENTMATLALLLSHGDKNIGIISVDVEITSDEHLKTIKRKLKWGSAWLLNQSLVDTDQNSSTPNTQVFSLLTLCIEQAKYSSAAFLVATEWAKLQGFERVSIGVRGSERSKVTAISDNFAFDKRANLVATIAFAMDEALDQKQDLSCPGSTGLWSILAQKTLLSEGGSSSVCTLRYRRGFNDSNQQVSGAITLEHRDPNFFTAETILLNRQFALMLGPLLELKREQERWIGARALAAFKHWLQRYFGGENYLSRFLAVTITALVLFIYLFPVNFKVSAPATIEGWTQRHMSAPIDGYLFESSVKAGDEVKQGQVLFSLDNRDLRLELLRWKNKLSQLDRQQLEALSKREMAQSGILTAQLKQAQAQVELITEQLRRTEVVAPFDSVVVKGDLTQRLGSPVRRGESLMVLAPLKDYRIVLNVNEHDIAYLHNGQTGTLKLSALSDEQFTFETTTVSPVGEVVDGKNGFRIDAKLLDANTQLLRPGMQGLAKVSVDRRKLLWIWTRRFNQWLELWLWQWWP